MRRKPPILPSFQQQQCSAPWTRSSPLKTPTAPSPTTTSITVPTPSKTTAPPPITTSITVPTPSKRTAPSPTTTSITVTTPSKKTAAPLSKRFPPFRPLKSLSTILASSRSRFAAKSMSSTLLHLIRHFFSSSLL